MHKAILLLPAMRCPNRIGMNRRSHREPTERGTTGERKYAAANERERPENPILKGIQALLVELFVVAHNAPLALSATGSRWFRW